MYFYPWKRFLKKDLENIIKKITEKFGQNAKFRVIMEKNGRGDYGFDEIYMVNKTELIKISFDGARQKIWCFFNYFILSNKIKS